MHDSGERDRAIDQVLRRGLAASATPPAAADCLDGETLAAWTSGALASTEAASIERHLSDCGRCQALLAAFVRTEPPAPAMESVWRQWHLPWLVPMATAATAVALWVVLPDRELTRAPQEVTAPRAEANQQVPSPEPAQPLVKQVPSPVAPAGPAAVPPAQTEMEERSRQEEAKTVAASPQMTADRLEKSKDLAVGRLAEDLRGATRPTPSATAPSREAAAAAAPEAALRMAAPPLDIVSPDARNRWRIVAGQQVERSGDGGQTWQPVDLSPPAALTAGSAPSPTICWIVGRAGSVYLTTDGILFVRLSFMETVDLIAVHATDGRTASVTASDGRVFSTSDAGITWTIQGS